MSEPITIYQLALHRLGIAPGDGAGLTGADFDRADLPIMGGCEICGASVAAYNAAPSKSGYIRCASGCIGDEGYLTVTDANRDIFGDD